MVTRKARIFHSGAKQRGLASSEGRTGIHTPENSYVWLGVSAHPWEVVFSIFTYVFASSSPHLASQKMKVALSLSCDMI